MMLNNSTRQSHHLLIATLLALIFIFMLSLSVSIRSKAADESATPPFNDICQSDIVRQLVNQFHDRYDSYAYIHYKYREVTRSAWSPDGRRLLTLDADKFNSEFFIWDLERFGVSGWSGDLDRFPFLISWSPDSYYFLTTNDGGEVYVRNATGSYTRRIMGVNPELYHATWSPDGKQFIAAGSKEMTLFDLRQLEPVQHFEVPETLFDVVWSRDNVHFITSGRDDDIYLWDKRFAAYVRQYKGQVGDATHIEWNPDGTHFLTGNNRGDVFLWDMGKETSVRQFKSLDRYSPLKDIKWSPDDQQFLTLNDNGNTFLWDVDDSQPIREFPTSKPNGGLQSVEWLPNGKHFVTSGRDVLLWNAEVSRPIWKFLPASGDALSVSLNPHDKLLVVTGEDGQVYVWDIEKLIHLLASMPDINPSVNNQSCRPVNVLLPPPTPNDATKTVAVEQSFATSHKYETHVADLNATSTSVVLTATAITFTPSLTFTAYPTIPTLTPTAIMPIIYQTSTALALTRQKKIPSSTATLTPIFLSTDETAMTLTFESIKQTATALYFNVGLGESASLTPSSTATVTPLPPTATTK